MADQSSRPREARLVIRGRIPPEKLQRFFKSNFASNGEVDVKESGSSAIRATGVCGAWGCPMEHKGRTIKRCVADIDEVGNTTVTCYY